MLVGTISPCGKLMLYGIPGSHLEARGGAENHALSLVRFGGVGFSHFTTPDWIKGG